MNHLANWTRLAGFLLSVAAASWLFAQSEPPPPTVDLSVYRHVVQVGWVVKDLDTVVRYWQGLGLRNIRRADAPERRQVVYRGKRASITLKTASGQIGEVEVEWVQPVRGTSAYNEFLAYHGDGVQHLAFAAGSPERMDEQVAYFQARGVGVLEEGTWPDRGRFVDFDTAPEGGGLTIELLEHLESAAGKPSTPAPNEEPFSRIVQYAFLVRDVKRVSAYWERLGFGGMSIDHNISVDRNYRGQAGKFEMYLGWWRWGDVAFEWIQPLVGPSVYEEYLKARGEGLHHLAFNVKDMDQAIEQLRSRGAAVAQSGGWNNPRSQGRFAYLDTDPQGGVTIELLWSKRP